MVLLIYTAALYFGLWLRISLKNEVNEKIVVSQSRDQTHKSRVLFNHVLRILPESNTFLLIYKLSKKKKKGSAGKKKKEA